MARERKILSRGTDHTDMFAIFRFLVERSGVNKGDALIWAGCEGACYATATFFGYCLEGLGLNQYFATDGDLIRAKVIVLMSGLANVPFENVLTIVRDGLAEDGLVIGETVVPGLFESLKWHEQVPIRFLFEFSMAKPTAIEMVEAPAEGYR